MLSRDFYLSALFARQQHPWAIQIGIKVQTGDEYLNQYIFFTSQILQSNGAFRRT
jgi:hypothetical protein